MKRVTNDDVLAWLRGDDDDKPDGPESGKGGKKKGATPGRGGRFAGLGSSGLDRLLGSLQSPDDRGKHYREGLLAGLARIEDGIDVEGEHLSSSSSSLASHGGSTTTSWSALWVLLWYSYLSALQSLLWMTFSSVPDLSKSFLQTDDATLDMWLDWGPVAYCCSVAPALWLLSSRRNGLQLSVRLASFLCLAASLLRCVPLLFSEEQRSANSVVLLGVIHAAQFLNGSVAPLVVASPSYLSLVWFPASTRNTATAVANVANALGRAVGFFLGPAIVSSASDLPTLLYLEIGLAALPFVATSLYLPAAPAVPPSQAAAEEARVMEQKEEARRARAKGEEPPEGSVAGGSSSVAVAFREIVTAVRVPSFLILALAGGLEMAVYGEWSGLLPTVLQQRYSDSQAGWFGTANTFAGIIGGLLAGLVTDVPALRNHLKGIVQVLAVLSAGAFAVLALCLPPVEQTSLSGPLGYAGMLAVATAAGLLRGGTDPLFFELSAEVVAPAGVPAGAAGGVLTFWYPVILCALLAAPPAFLKQYTMLGMAGLMGLSAVLLAPVRVTYTRR
jgi:MFS family permease